jgi:aldehyde dehydrogenase (NAD(P)+)
MTSVLAGPAAAVVDRAVEDLGRGETAWARCDLAERRTLLERVHAAVGREAAEWARTAARYKGLADDSPLVGEEWISGPYAVLVALATLTRSVRALEAGGSPIDGLSVDRAPGGRLAVRVLPATVYDRLLLNGFRADVWMPPGVKESTIRATAGLALRRPTETAGVGVVLGAGNITSIPVLDVLYELYANNRVVALKLNPITDPLLGVFSRVLAPLVDLGAVRILTGGSDVGGYLVHHPRVGHVHLTGSVLTHDAIVFGTGPDGAARKVAGTPLLAKPFTSELGGVSPIIVLPGQWSRADLRFQAEHVATQRLHNGGYNCIASQVVVVSSDWPQRSAFLHDLRAAMASAAARAAYYPGSDARVADALACYPEASTLGGTGRVLIDGLRVRAGEPALSTEYFAPVMGVVELPGEAAPFLAAAVEAANGSFAGTLGANLIAHPRTIAALGPVLDEAIAALRYGTVAVNAWTGVGYLTPGARWGAYPGHTVDDVQSGIGLVHNAVLLDGPERTVVRGPFRPAPRSIVHGELSLAPRPPWFVTNRTAATTGERLTRFAADPRWTRLPGVFASALRG